MSIDNIAPKPVTLLVWLVVTEVRDSVYYDVYPTLAAAFRAVRASIQNQLNVLRVECHENKEANARLDEIQHLIDHEPDCEILMSRWCAATKNELVFGIHEKEMTLE